MQKWIALLGKPEAPTDGVEDYCAFLGKALRPYEVELEIARVRWDEGGWRRALRALAAQSESWRGGWVFVQYTALAWSRRGFPLGALRAMRVLERRGARVGVVFHECSHQPARRSVIRPLRAGCQDLVIRRLHARASLSIFTVPPATISWVNSNHRKPVSIPAVSIPVVSIPIGANIPAPEEGALRAQNEDRKEKTVAVFCFSPGPEKSVEIADVIHAVKACRTAGQSVRLALVGRGSDDVRSEAEAQLGPVGVRVDVLGVVSAEAVSKTLAEADALLFVREPLAQMRGSALAGIACGLPVVGYAGAAEGTPIAEAGLQLAPFRNRELLAAALCRVIADGDLRAELRRRSLDAQRRYFSWSAIAKQYIATCAPETAKDALAPAADGSAMGSSIHSSEVEPSKVGASKVESSNVGSPKVSLK